MKRFRSHRRSSDGVVRAACGPHTPNRLIPRLSIARSAKSLAPENGSAPIPPPAPPSSPPPSGTPISTRAASSCPTASPMSASPASRDRPRRCRCRFRSPHRQPYSHNPLLALFTGKHHVTASPRLLPSTDRHRACGFGHLRRRRGSALRSGVFLQPISAPQVRQRRRHGLHLPPALTASTLSSSATTGLRSPSANRLGRSCACQHPLRALGIESAW